MKPGRWILLALALGAGATYAARKVPAASRLFGTRGDAEAPVSHVPRMVPENTRIKVEVLNATATRGLARRATQYLRDRGFDVVEIGTAREQRSQTLVLDRSGHPEWAQLAARAMNARVETRVDSSRYLDLTVLVGADWRPPALPFYP